MSASLYYRIHRTFKMKIRARPAETKIAMKGKPLLLVDGHEKVQASLLNYLNRMGTFKTNCDHQHGFGANDMEEIGYGSSHGLRQSYHY